MEDEEEQPIEEGREEVREVVLDVYKPKALASSIPAALAVASSFTFVPKLKRRASCCSDCSDPDCKGGAANGVCQELLITKRCKNCKSSECYSNRRKTTPYSSCPKCVRCKDEGCNVRPCVTDLESSEIFKDYIALAQNVKDVELGRRRVRDRKKRKEKEQE